MSNSRYASNGNAWNATPRHANAPQNDGTPRTSPTAKPRNGTTPRGHGTPRHASWNVQASTMINQDSKMLSRNLFCFCKLVNTMTV